jgi:hypothetical protein
MNHDATTAHPPTATSASIPVSIRHTSNVASGASDGCGETVMHEIERYGPSCGS